MTDKRLEWQTPTFRKLATRQAEGVGPNQSEGNMAPNGSHSGKRL